MDIRGIENIEKAMIKEADNRFDEWNAKKKLISRKKPVNKNDTNKVIFDIMPWTIWWFEAGENVGHELGTHIDHNANTYRFNRPCLVISKLKSLKDTDDSVVTVIPLSTKSEGIGIHKKYVHLLEATKYPKGDRLKGLSKDSYAICHQIKSIDTKRLISMVHKRINDDDITAIQHKIKKYIDLP